MSCGTSPASAGEQEPVAETFSEGLTLETVQIGEILWYVDYDRAVEFARAEDKPLWVHFGEDPG